MLSACALSSGSRSVSSSRSAAAVSSWAARSRRKCRARARSTSRCPTRAADVRRARGPGRCEDPSSTPAGTRSGQRGGEVRGGLHGVAVDQRGQPVDGRGGPVVGRCRRSGSSPADLPVVPSPARWARAPTSVIRLVRRVCPRSAPACAAGPQARRQAPARCSPAARGDVDVTRRTRTVPAMTTAGRPARPAAAPGGGFDGTTSPPPPHNEPVLGYAPGSRRADGLRPPCATRSPARSPTCP